MKYVLIIPDGCADQPQASLNGRTPLQAAQLPAMDQVANRGVVGAANHVPPHLPPGSDVANLSLLGYDPNRYFSGRAPLEAAAQGIALGPHDWAVRCNLVCIQDQVMRDFTAGHISTAEATALLETANQHLTDASIRFVPGVSYRNLMIVRAAADRTPPFSMETSSTPPHDLTDQSVVDAYPQGVGSDLLCHLMNESLRWFENHPVNQQRIAAGKRPATNIWLWGLGLQPNLTSFHSRFGVRGVMITAVDLLRGLAKLVGWDLIEVPTATGYIDTDYAAKGRAAVAALDQYDFVTVHIEAPDEASHQGLAAEKIKALEEIDRHIVAPLWSRLQKEPEWRIMVTPDHPTLLSTKTHSHGMVPFAVAGSNVTPDASQTYDEAVAAGSSLQFPNGWELMPWYLG
ncbi:MAG: cofactor-independent phosphoglycerate mutase [Planctomycetaceae bacterium]|nr:cofactor-independent phosphoglycerate mutase [Planctomycetaceae bacterium]